VCGLIKVGGRGERIIDDWHPIGALVDPYIP